NSLKSFDYIICGAGAAGCVLANKLTADPSVEVLLLEAGPSDKTFLTKMPRGFAQLLLNETRARFFQTGPDKGAKPDGEVWSRGRMLGGSSSINGMLYFHGNPGDYDGWEALGNNGWGWNEIRRVFQEMEDHSLGPGKCRGSGGPVGVSINPYRSELIDALISAGSAEGLGVVEDINEPPHEGIGYTPYNIRKGERSGASQAFLHPILHRSNLTVVTGALVSRVLFDGRVACGVECVVDGSVTSYETSGEVILSCGALQSPQVLELSGIGQRALLEELGINVILDSPGVGENLREHCLIVMQRRLKKPWSKNAEFSGWRLYKNVAKYALSKKGLMAYPGFDMSALVRIASDTLRPDVHLIASRTSMDLRSWDGWTKGPTLESLPGMQLMGYPTNPQSQGSVHIKSKNPEEPPEIQANYLTHPYDRKISIDMFRYMRKLLSHDSLTDVIGEETIPGPHVESDEDILDAFSAYCGPGYHACGSVKMGADDLAVVDSRCRVRGVTGLRVVDISIFPTQTTGNTNAPAMAVAARASELINEERANT
ncbi:GMC family oxidoreductase, partial [Luminiphilus syltensis]